MERSGVTGKAWYIIIESRRDDTVVQDIASTTEASIRDAEGIGQSLSVHSASLHTRLEHSALFRLVHEVFHLNSSALIRPI